MKHTPEEIITALQVIKSQCEAVACCSDCRFGTMEGVCLAHERTPDRWRLLEPYRDIWRALNEI